MPYRTEWVEPDVYLLHNGVFVYCMYDEDDVDNGPQTYWYTVNSQALLESEFDHEGVFDIRDLENPDNHNLETESGRQAFLRQLIEAGVLTEDGKVELDDPTPQDYLYLRRYATIFYSGGGFIFGQIQLARHEQASQDVVKQHEVTGKWIHAKDLDPETQRIIGYCPTEEEADRETDEADA